MGTVFDAWDPVLCRHLAVKLIAPVADAGILLEEARAQAAVQHKNVLPVYDAGIVDGELFVAMALVSPQAGRTNASLRARMHDAPLAQKLSWLRDAATGLAAAHAAGITHRDFKPENVLVDDDGARVCDFGLARKQASRAAPGTDDTEGPNVSGTPAYLAPEQTLGSEGDARSDQYAFGVVLFECVYGHHPLLAEGPKSPHSWLALRDAIRAGIALPDKPVPAWLRAVIKRTVAKDPSQRFTDMACVATALAGPTQRAHRWLQVAKVSLWLAALGHAALLLGMLLVALRPQDFPPSDDAAPGVRDTLLIFWICAGLPLCVACLVGLKGERRWTYGLMALYAVVSIPTCIGTPVTIPLVLALANADLRRALGVSPHRLG
jgi:serine/threonine protein kinase